MHCMQQTSEDDGKVVATSCGTCGLVHSNRASGHTDQHLSYVADSPPLSLEHTPVSALGFLISKKKINKNIGKQTQVISCDNEVIKTCIYIFVCLHSLTCTCS